MKQGENSDKEIDKASTYEKQKSRAKAYYYHKDERAKKQKEYQKKQGGHTNSRNRLFGSLNSTPDYEKTMRDTIKPNITSKTLMGYGISYLSIIFLTTKVD